MTRSLAYVRQPGNTNEGPSHAARTANVSVVSPTTIRIRLSQRAAGEKCTRIDEMMLMLSCLISRVQIYCRFQPKSCKEVITWSGQTPARDLGEKKSMQEKELDPRSFWSGLFSPWKSWSVIGSNRNVFLVNARHTHTHGVV